MMLTGLLRRHLLPGWRALNVLIQSPPGQPSGLTGRVVVEPGRR